MRSHVVVRTFASFRWDVTIGTDEEQPFAPKEVAALVASFRAAGVTITAPDDAEYVWAFYGELPHLGMDCALGLCGDNQWLLTCNPQRGLVNWVLGRWWEQEQEDFIRRLTEALHADERISELRWYTKEEWGHAGV